LQVGFAEVGLANERAKINDSGRVFWVRMRRLLDSRRETLLIVKPETVIHLLRCSSRRPGLLASDLHGVFGRTIRVGQQPQP